MWQADLVNEGGRRRHFPDAAQLVGDVREVDPARLPRVDLLTAGFPCTDLSQAGRRKGLDGPASGLYREVLRFCGARAADLYDPDKPRVVYGGGYQPPQVLMENVPELLNLMRRLGNDFRALGYGLTWVVCEASDAGSPQLRLRVFVLAELGVKERGLVEVDAVARWRPDGLRKWPTAITHNHTIGGRAQRGEVDDLVSAAFMRPWHTPATRDTDQGKRLNPLWVEALMGYPLGWTAPEGAALADIPPPVRGRYPVGWDRSVPWPGFDWEPARTLPDGVKAPGRAARIRGLGNAWAPAQGALALRALLAPAQVDLFGGGR